MFRTSDFKKSEITKLNYSIPLHNKLNHVVCDLRSAVYTEKKSLYFTQDKKNMF